MVWHCDVGMAKFIEQAAREKLAREIEVEMQNKELMARK
jgi:hypothetical protein